MPVLIAYLLKLSVALAAVFLFYQLVLRRLTFYNWNRWYLLLYTAAAFCIPLIDVNPVLEEQRWSGSRIVNLVPVLQQGVLRIRHHLPPLRTKRPCGRQMRIRIMRLYTMKAPSLGM